ncbi:MAG: PD-(D/E)XK nuclease family protein [Deltaproteobacteria bacterium]|nr:PD-(D/E)XK nuclease family protein [Deltaproteobacteria bacterium]
MTGDVPLDSFFGLGAFFPPDRLVVVPNELVVFQIRDQIMRRQEVLLNVKICSFGHLENSLAEEYWPELVDETTRLFFLNRLAPALREVLELKGEPTIGQTAELADQLADGLDRLRLAGLTWDQIAALKPPPLAESVANLGRQYERWLGARDDRFSRRLKILKALEKRTDFTYLKNVTTINCFHSQRLSPFETSLIKALALSGREVYVRLETPKWLLDEEKNVLNRSFQKLRAYRDLEASNLTNLHLTTADPEGADEPEATATPKVLKFASHNLFGPPPTEDPPPVTDEIVILKAPARYLEVEAVGREIKKDLLAKIPPSRIAVVVPLIDDWLNDFMDVGRRFHLKFYRRRGESLANAGPVLAVFDLLALFASTWELPRIVEVLRSPYFDFGLLDWPLDDLLTAGVIDDRLETGFELNLNKAISKNQEKAELLKPVLMAGEKLRSFSQKIRETTTWPQLLAALAEILDSFGWPNLEAPVFPETKSPEILALAKEYEPKLKMENAAAESFRAVLDSLADSLADSLEAPSVSLETLIFWLNRAVAQSYLALDQSLGDRVWLLNYYDLHGAKFDKLYLMGLNESLFPAAKAESRWWPDEFMKSLGQTALNRSLWSTPFETYQMGEEILATALGQAKKVTLSYSEFAVEGENKLLLPSSAIMSLLALWPPKDNKNKDPDKAALDPAKASQAQGQDKKDKEAKDKKSIDGPKILATPKVLGLTDLRDYNEFLVYLASLDQEPDPRLLDLLPFDYRTKIWPALKERSQPLTTPILTAETVANWLNRQPRMADGPLLNYRDLLAYQNCSLSFWLANIARLSPPPEPTEEWPYYYRYGLLKSTIAEFYRPLLNPAINRPLDESTFEAIFTEKVSQMAKSAPLGREPFYKRTLNKLKNDLRVWLTRSLAKPIPLIWALNWRFGPVYSETNEKPLPGAPVALGKGPNRFYLPGQVPLIEIESETYVVYDYHFGKPQKSLNPSPPLTTVEDFLKKASPMIYAPLLFQLAVSQNLGKKTLAKVSFVSSLSTDPLETTLATDPEVFAKAMEQIYADFLQGLEKSPDKSEKCGDCAFFAICPNRVVSYATEDEE